MKWFEIAPENEGVVKLNEETLKGELTFTVTNVSGKALRAHAAVIPQEGEQNDWMSIKGHDIRPMAEHGEETFTVGIAAPKEAKPGTYAITFVVCNEADPEEETAEVKAKFEIVKPDVGEGKRPIWPWIVAGASALVVVGVIVAVIVYIATRRPPLLADFGMDSPSGVAPLTVSFEDRSRGEPDSWEWTFGAAGKSTERDPHFTFTTPGTYDVILKVKRGSNEDTREQRNLITVAAPKEPPVAQFTAEVLASSSSNVGLTRPAPAPPAVEGGKSVVRDHRAPAPPPPVAMKEAARLKASERMVGVLSTVLRVSIIRVTTKQTVRFIDVSSGHVTSRSWNFGDGASSNEQHPRHRYSKPGTFTVSLTVKGPGGDNTVKKPNFVQVTAR